MKTDLLILWSWEYDSDFLDLLQTECIERGLSVLVLGPGDLASLPDRLNDGSIDAGVVLDRAWDWGGEFARHCDAVRASGIKVINDYDLVRRAWNKPTMHYEIIKHGLRAPYLIVLPSYESSHDPAVADIPSLGNRFSVKGAHSGGSGVLVPACTWNEVLLKRQEWPSDESILQTWVEPMLMGKRRAWFRVFYACGVTFPCWADDLTHEQTPVTPEDERKYQLYVLRGMAQQVAGLCRLNAFSTEIALNHQHIWQIVDYVNEPCDYRLKSKAINGVPDEVVHSIAQRIAGWIERMAQNT